MRISDWSSDVCSSGSTFMNIAKALLLISACLVAGSTFAADDKTWSSVACRGYGLNTSDSELTFQNAGLYNPQNNYETVICPIEMDREGGWGKIGRAHV